MAFDFDALAVPQMREILVPYHPLLLRPALHIEYDYLIVVEQVQPYLPELHLNVGQRPRNLYMVVEL